MTITVNRKVQECEKTGCLFYVYKYSTPDGLEFPTPDLAFHHIERQNTVSDWSSRGVYEGSVVLHRNTERTYGKVIRILSDSKYLELLLKTNRKKHLVLFQRKIIERVTLGSQLHNKL